MDIESTVHKILGDLSLIDESGGLLPLDSLAMVDLVIHLGNATGLTIPVPRSCARRASFDSEAAIIEMLRQLAGSGASEV